MSDLTPERLAALRALAGKATPGPWFYDSYSRVSSVAKTQRYDDIDFPDCKVPAWKTSCGEPQGSCHGCPFFEVDYRESPIVATVPAHHGDTATGQSAADAEYLAAVSPDVVAGLLDEIDRLHAERGRIAGRLRQLADDGVGRSCYNALYDLSDDLDALGPSATWTGSSGEADRD